MRFFESVKVPSWIFLEQSVFSTATSSTTRNPTMDIFGACLSCSLLGLTIFMLLVLGIATSSAKALFLATHGWSHRVAGAALLAWILYGVLQIVLQAMTSKHNGDDNNRASQWFFYDTLLGIMGIATTLTAARDFPHKHVQNAKGQSGSLSQKAIVTQAEMVEHSFYQALNLLQAWYLHFISTTTPTTPATTLMALWLVTSPWYCRKYFPVHSFSHNWNITPVHQRTQQEVLLYRLKKAQYLFYKHVLLHGLNISMALQTIHIMQQDQMEQQTRVPWTTTIPWRLYWLALNTSYVMEFFLQTLVRRQIIKSSTMFGLQRLLMITSSIAAMMILLLFQEGNNVMVQPAICLVSLLLNLIHRGHDVTNVFITTGIFFVLQQQNSNEPN